MMMHGIQPINRPCKKLNTTNLNISTNKSTRIEARSMLLTLGKMRRKGSTSGLLNLATIRQIGLLTLALKN
jgi:hypothetical protein